MAIRSLVILTFVVVSFPLNARAQPTLSPLEPDGVQATTSIMESAIRFASEEASAAAAARRRKNDPLWNGPVIGFGIGAVVGLIGAAGCDDYSSCGSSTGEFVALYGAIGAGVGLAVDVLLTRGHATVPAKASPLRSRSVQLSPMLGGQRGLSAVWNY
jgi:hypothetical protein